MRVWRFPLNAESQDDTVEADEHVDPPAGRGHSYTCDVEMPQGATIVALKQSSRGLTLYALVDADAETETRSFFVCGNGVEIPEGADHVLDYRGTYKRAGGTTAHVFEIAKVTA